MLGRNLFDGGRGGGAGAALTSCPYADPRSVVSSSPVTSCWSCLASEPASTTLKEEWKQSISKWDHLGHLNNCAHIINILSPALFMKSMGVAAFNLRKWGR